jgi:predicted membrane protein
MRKSRFLTLISLFSALHAIFVLIPLPFRSLMVIIQPLEGIILGIYGGFLSALLGSIVGRIIRPMEGLLPIFGITAEPIGALVSALFFRKKWKHVFLIYLFLLLGYFIHPLGRILPAWCLWNTYIAFILTFISPLFLKKIKEETNSKKLAFLLALTSFIGIEADALVRIFILIPVGFYSLMGIPEEALVPIWIAGAIQTPIEAILSIIATIILGIPLIKILKEIK